MDAHAEGYLDELERILRYLRHRRFRHLWAAPAHPEEWHGRPAVMQSLALQHAVLHHHTRRAEHLRWAKQHLLDFDQGYHFGALFSGKAYELIPDAFTPAERDTFANAYVAGAQHELHRYVAGAGVDPRVIDTWEQVANHPLCACVYADNARRLFPAQSRPYHFERMTDRVWKLWWARGDFGEQATNYEGFSMNFLCAWAELRGKAREFYATPTVRNMLERSERIVSPSGIVTAYADSGHNEHATAWVALYEMAARHTHNSQWRRLPWEVFGYVKRRSLLDAARALKRVADENVYNGRYMYGLFLHAMSWLGMAALCSDGSVKPKPRTDFAGLNARPPVGYLLTRADRRRLPTDRLVPCQVALAGGPTRPNKRTYLLLSVGPKYPHDHADAGSILMLSRGDAVLLGTNGYLQRELPYHHVFHVQSADQRRFPDDAFGRIVTGDPACAGRIEHLDIQDHAAACRVAFEPYHGHPVSLVREVIVGADGEVLVLDRAVAHADGLCAGPLFHAERVRRVGAHAFRLRVETLRSINGLELANAPGELVVEFLCPAGRSGVITMRAPAVYTQQGGYRRFPCNHYVKVWRAGYTARRCVSLHQPLPKGRETLFVTRLVPSFRHGTKVKGGVPG